jgi:hypothetical protein
VSERFDAQARDRLLGRARLAGWAVGAAAAGATALLSVVAAHAFQGHRGTASHAATPSAASASSVRVPPPQDVPAIDGAPPPLQPPPSPPEAVAPQPAPVTSGGS